jgi:1,4-dihydroxy-2-naphthoate octaprenyltransferase
LSESQLSSRVTAIKDLLDAFRFERAVYLSITMMSLFVLLACALSLMFGTQDKTVEAIGLFSSSGAITYTTGRLLRMWSDAMQILSPKAEDK